jgi:ribosomal protein L11 methyltransferase
MFSLELRAEPPERDLLVADLWEEGSVGIVELDETRLRAFFEDHTPSQALLARFAGYGPRLREEENRDWVAFSRENWRPIVAGSRFFLVPEWRDDPAPPGRFRISINPGMAFGTGVHETTQLAIEALERHVQPGRTVLDIGTGSGILAQVAELLGAAKIYACDNDPTAVEVARTNLRSTHVAVGSADAIAARAADVLVANISPEAMAALAGDFRRVLKPGGIALLSGFENAEVAAVERSLAGLSVKARYSKGDWALLECI